MRRAAAGARLSALAAGLLVALGCAAQRSGPSALQRQYLAAHPLPPDEAARLAAREARRGDTLDRVRATFDDCDWEEQERDGELAIWRVHLPVDVRPARLDLDRIDEVPPGADVLLTFRRDRLERAMILR